MNPSKIIASLVILLILIAKSQEIEEYETEAEIEEVETLSGPDPSQVSIKFSHTKALDVLQDQ